MAPADGGLAQDPWVAYMVSVSQYFGLHGMILDQYLRKLYVLNENVTCHFWGPARTELEGPQRLITRHTMNREQQLDTTEQYSNIIMEKGMYKGVSAEPIGVPKQLVLETEACCAFPI